ncbi:hypothetical protein ACFYZ9_38635 [Streptomyces sp. NPDC001691]|uniref:hypothetical protein n=1 Tax=Streptomyces sp. NPDC001691 TaxID=3364600 RepID=UPI0036CA963D
MSEFNDHVRLTLDGHHTPEDHRRNEMRWSPAPGDAPTEAPTTAEGTASSEEAAAVLKQAQDAFFALLDVLGAGVHTVVCYVESPFGGQVGFLHLLTDDDALIAVDEVEALAFWVTLSFGLQPGATGGVVVRTTTPDDAQSARGWSLRDGWLHPLTAREVRNAYSVSPESGAPMEPELGVDYLSAEVLTRPSPEPAPGHDQGGHGHGGPPDRRPPNRTN